MQDSLWWQDDTKGRSGVRQNTLTYWEPRADGALPDPCLWISAWIHLEEEVPSLFLFLNALESSDSDRRFNESSLRRHWSNSSRSTWYAPWPSFVPSPRLTSCPTESLDSSLFLSITKGTGNQEREYKNETRSSWMAGIEKRGKAASTASDRPWSGSSSWSESCEWKLLVRPGFGGNNHLGSRQDCMCISIWRFGQHDYYFLHGFKSRGDDGVADEGKLDFKNHHHHRRHSDSSGEPWGWGWWLVLMMWSRVAGRSSTSIPGGMQDWWLQGRREGKERTESDSQPDQ